MRRTLHQAIEVSSAGSTDNIYISDVIGNKSDLTTSRSLYGRVKHVLHGLDGLSDFYPSLDANVTLTAGATAWGLGAIGTIISSGSAPAGFHVHQVHADNASANATYAVYLYAGSSGSEVKVGESRFTRTTGSGSVSPSNVLTAHIDGTTRVSAAVAASISSTTPITLGISVGVHYYDG